MEGALSSETAVPAGEGGAPTITRTNVLKHAKCCKEPLEQPAATRDDAGAWLAVTSESRVSAGLTQRVAFERKLEEVKTGVQRILGEVLPAQRPWGECLPI